MVPAPLELVKQPPQPGEIADELIKRFGALMYAHSKGNEDVWRQNLLKIGSSDDLKG